MTLGEAVKNYLSENGIKQTFVAEKTGIPDSTLSLILSGNRKIDSVEYYKICKALDVSMEKFFEVIGI